jgi:hypothetical protein
MMGVGGEWYLDIFIINLSCQGLTILTDWYWLPYLSIPAYIFYHCWGWFKAWADNSGKGEEEEMDPAMAKKQAKKERVKYKTIKR